MVNQLDRTNKTKMNIGKDEKHQIAQVFSFLLSGEKVAHHCALKQAEICSDTNMKRFFIKQSRQEKFHATIFQSAIMWLTPKGVRCPAQKPMENYHNILRSATDNNDLLSSVIGLQVILEGMGDVVLSRFNHGINQRDIGYKKIRQAIIEQEDLHHEFGLRYIETHDTTSIPETHTEHYLSLISDMFISFETLLEFFDEDGGNYLTEFNNNLPDQIRAYAVNHHPHS